jgi:hypothetical protein
MEQAVAKRSLKKAAIEQSWELILGAARRADGRDS